MKLNIKMAIFVFALFAMAAVEKPLSCTFPTKTGTTVIEKCATKSKTGKLNILKQAKAKIKFDSLGLAGGSIAEIGCFWFSKKGTLMKTHCFDNGADFFQDGLARYIDDKGKFGFMNEKLQIKIPAQYTFAFPFEYGNAKICMGCAPLKGKASEHSILNGGKWQIINKSGQVIKDCKNAKREYQCLPE